MAERHTFPQSGDQDYADNFAQMVGQAGLTGFVGSGMGVSFNSSTEIAITTGVAYFRQSSVTLSGGSSDGEERLNVGKTVQLPDSTLTVTDSTIEHVYIEPNLGTDDNAQFNSYENTANAPADALKIAEVDTTNDTIDEDFNRATQHAVSGVIFREGPDAEFNFDYDKSQDAVVVSDDDNDVDLLRLNKNDAIDALVDIDFPNIGGSPSFASHDHSEAGLSKISNAGLDNATLTINAGDGLVIDTGQATTEIGDSIELAVEPDDFAGTFLSDDGSDNLTVDLGDGLENDGSGNIRVDLGTGLEFSGSDIRVDEDFDFTFTSEIDFSSGLDIGGGNISIGGSIIAQAVVASGGGSLSNGSLDVDTGVSDTVDATFYPAIGTDTDNSKISARIYQDSGSGTYHVEFIETGTTVGNTSIDYDIVRVR